MEEKEEFINLIHQNYQGINEKMVKEIKLSGKHPGITGNFREEMWIDFFKNIIPKKFSLAQGVIIIDSTGERSNEVDIAIYDEQYTPYILQYGSLKFIPIEAVVCVVECKSKNPDSLKLIEWSNSIDKLESNPTGIARVIQGLAIGLTNKTQQRTRPIKIQVSLKEERGNIFENSLKGHFDIIIRPIKTDNKKDVKEEEKKQQQITEKFNLTVHNEEETLGWWIKELNNYNMEGEIKNTLNGTENILRQDYLKMDGGELKNTLANLRIEGNEILTLTFQLNQLLMLINNPMMFPHFAYAKTFNDIIERLDKN